MVIRVKLISEPTKGFKIFLKGFEDFEGQESLVKSLLRYLISLEYSRLYDCKKTHLGSNEVNVVQSKHRSRLFHFRQVLQLLILLC